MENSTKMRWRDWENSSKAGFVIAGFEIPNEFTRAVTESAEGTEEKVRDNESSTKQVFAIQSRTKYLEQNREIQ